jgi:hypothetical protein
MGISSYPPCIQPTGAPVGNLQDETRLVLLRDDVLVALPLGFRAGIEGDARGDVFRRVSEYAGLAGALDLPLFTSE